MELNRELYIKGVSDYLENGKNLLKLTDGTYENNGITVVVSNGIITINGTATNTSFISIPYAFANLTLYSGKTYTLSCNNTTIASGGLSVRPIGDLGTFQADLGRTNSTSTTTISSNQTGTYLLIRSNSGVVANNVVVKPQLEEGPIATNFELYNGGYVSKGYLEPLIDNLNSKTAHYISEIGLVSVTGASNQWGWNSITYTKTYETAPQIYLQEYANAYAPYQATVVQQTTTGCSVGIYNKPNETHRYMYMVVV